MNLSLENLLIVLLQSFAVGLVVALLIYLATRVISFLILIDDIKSRQIASLTGALVGLLFFLTHI